LTLAQRINVFLVEKKQYCKCVKGRNEKKNLVGESENESKVGAKDVSWLGKSNLRFGFLFKNQKKKKFSRDRDKQHSEVKNFLLHLSSEKIQIQIKSSQLKS